MDKISIVIPCRNEEAYLVNCIESIFDADIEQENLDLIFVDGMSEDRTRDIIQEYMMQHPNIHLLDNVNKYTPVAMNIGIQEAKGEYIFILSAHAKYEKDYFVKLVHYCKELDADCTGAILITDVKNKNIKSNSIKEVMSHSLGVGNATFRTGSAKIKKVDTVAFGCYKKEVFEKYGLFDEKLIRNQDIELNKRIINRGGKIYLIPDVACTYYARENFRALAKNQYQNGFWNILTAYYTKTLNSLSLRHFVPLIFVVSLIVPFGISLVVPQILWLSFFSLASYLTLVIIMSIKLKNSSNSIIYLLLSFLTLHLSYGLGSFMGIFSVINKYVKGKK